MTYVAENMRRDLAGHELILVSRTKEVTAFYLKAPGTRMMSTLLLFTPEGIVLQGDLTPERKGSLSDLGYGPGWFSGKLSEGYLCEKFLEHKWVPERAAEELRDPDGEWLCDQPKKVRDRVLEIAEEIDGGDMQPGMVAEELQYLDFDLVDGVPGYTWEPGEAGWLCAIQQRFAELYVKPNLTTSGPYQVQMVDWSDENSTTTTIEVGGRIEPVRAGDTVTYNHASDADVGPEEKQ